MYLFLWEIKEIELKAYSKYQNMFQMKNTAVDMVLKGRRVEEWVRGPWVVTNQRAEHLYNHVTGSSQSLSY
jgi:hypothetical protein